MELKQQNYLPDQLLSADARSLHKLIPEPTLFHLPGKQPEPLFISVLLHGNETTGFLALQKLLNKYAGQELPRALSIFFGNTEAASSGIRRLEAQPDFNRIWPGTEIPRCQETDMAAEIVDIMQNKQVFASIDIHNNTGINPHYACVNKLDNQFLQLANLFGRLIVYFIRPKGVQCGAFAEICPAVTLECGKPDQRYGLEHAFQYLDSCIHLGTINQNPVNPKNIDIYHTVAQVKIRSGVKFGFEQTDVEFILDKDIERMNFTEICAGTQFGLLTDSTKMPLTVINEKGESVTDQFFSIVDNRLQIVKNTMPSMLTLNTTVIEQDCMCYLMEKIKR